VTHSMARIRSVELMAGMAAVVFVFLAPRGVASADEGTDFFENRVRPLLVAHCYECHSGEKTKGGLALDTKSGWELGGESGPALVPHRVAESLILSAVRHEGLEMPPGKKLEASEIATLEEWIRLGAPDPRNADAKLGGMREEEAKTWWAFQPLPNYESDLDASRIDRWLNSAMESQGLTPSLPADRRVWLRRATYDLTGLPPTAEEVDAFEEDDAPDAYEKVMERLLASPQYGVQWGRHWLDVVRYADTAGENTDRPLPHAWRYRNWVMDALQRDMPYDQFVRMQIAGDLLGDNGTPTDRRDGIVATGYLAMARRFGHDIDKDMHLTYEDVIDNLGKAFLGLSMGCARCHDHKYDPITARDYYGMVGIFASTRFSFPGCEPKGQPRDLVPLLSEIETDVLLGPWRERQQAIEAANQKIRDEIDVARKGWLERTGQATRLLTESRVEEGASVPLEANPGTLEAGIRVRRGTVLQLTILPNGNHGADSTRVEWNLFEIDGEGRSWSTAELIDGLTATNPHPGAHGSHWCFVESTQSGPAFLNEIRASNGGSDAIVSRSIGDLPSIFSNRSTEPAHVWTVLPPRSLFMHPGPGRPATLAWISPIDGVVRVMGQVADAHPADLDGVSFRLEQLDAPEAGPALLELGKVSSVAMQPLEPQPILPVAFAVMESEPKSVQEHVRGDPEKLGEVVPRRWLQVFGGEPVPPESGSGRKELAEWISSHPLLARVMVNRIWQWHFGHGLVRTANDFGSRGEAPDHPELLDWLATQFVRSGYSIRAMHRLIMRSDAYRRSSLPAGAARSMDPDNRLGAYFSRRRLSAEELRDTLLFVSGNLDTGPGEAHPFPLESLWGFTQHDPFNAVYDHRKRSAYLMVQRQRRHPFLALFDGADPNASTAMRQNTTVPTQALYFLNDPFFHEQSSGVSSAVLSVEGQSQRAIALYRRVFQRSPTDRELDACARFVEQYPAPVEEKWSAWVRVLMASNEFLYLD